MKIQTIRERLLAGTMIGGVALATAVALPVASVVLAPTSASAQDYTTGTLAGSVTDDAGNPIPGATVAIRSTEQGFSRTTTTDASGDFRAALVPLGGYQVTITAPGYDPVIQTANVALGGTSSYSFQLAAAGASGATDLGDVVVTAARQSLDFAQTTTGLTVDLEELVKTTPIGRDITAVTLLAPGTVQGDSTFGNVPSVGGSSVAENAFYLNGLNITNFDNYIGASTVPFDFYRSVEVKTGGYPAEFGRATGGIINAVSKSGTNDFYLGLHGNFAPDALRSQSPDTYASANSEFEATSNSQTVELGGPILRDRLFFYGLAEFRQTDQTSYSISSQQATKIESDDPFYGAKIDAYITNDHRLEFTYLDTTRESEYSYFAWDVDTRETGDQINTALAQAGGESYVARYTGSFTDWLTISAAYGVNRDSNVFVTGDPTQSYALDSRDLENPVRLSQQTASSYTPVRETEREFYRIDADLYFSLLGDHHVRFGMDNEQLSLTRQTERTGGQAYYYYTAEAGTEQAQGSNLAPGQDYVEINRYRAGGTFEGENEAYYVQDQWDVNDQLSLSLGVRLDKFSIAGAGGDTVVTFDEEIGPRLGFTFDPDNDGRARIFGSYSRYYLPVATNTGYRMSSSELYYSQYYLLDGEPGANGVPNLGDQITDWDGANICPPESSTPGIRGCRVTADGSAPPTESLIAQNLESTVEDEYILGYERRFGDLWTLGANVHYRELLRNAEDVAVDLAVNQYCEANGIAGCEDIWTGFHQYVIINPGASSTITLSDPLPGETDLRTIDFSAAELGYPKAKRTYTALELTFERAFDGVWGLNGSYTLSESKGNTEGYVKSDVGQTDAGITQDFDQPGLVDGADGLTPNHRAHQFKVYGSYQVLPDLLVGANLQVASPRHFGCMGFHPTDPYANAYGAASWYCNGELTPRGSQLESDWQTSLDVSVRYNVPLAIPGDLVLRADVFNIFNSEAVTDIYEFGESTGVGVPHPRYGLPIGYQSPRYIRLGFDWTF